MKNNMKTYAFVPAKGTSERIKNKNMQFLDGERLYIRALKILLKCHEIDEVFLDTESEEMYHLVDYLPVRFLKRNVALANNQTDGHQIFMNEVKSFPDADIYVQLLCTSPFIKPETIDSAIKKLKNEEQYDSAVMMRRDKYYFWENNKPKYNSQHIPNSKDLPYTLSESMGLYIHRKDSAMKLNRRYGDNPYMIFGDLEELIDVNVDEDFAYAEVYAKGKRQEENNRLRLIKHFVSSPALSDLLDDMKCEKGEICGAVINGFRCNIPGSKLLGRANTLKLRSLKDGENFKGIYDALQSYQGIADNDIIVVENEESDYAYFGDLNARLAIKSGACGTIVNGVTRDNLATARLNYPVFARGYNATDVRRRATLDYINKPIKFGDKLINPGDLVFVDDCAMVVIYHKYEDEVIERVIGTFQNEKEIVNDILRRKSIEQIVNLRGAF